MLGPQGGLDPVKEPLEPTEELSLRDPDLGFTLVPLDRAGQLVQLALELRREGLAELIQGGAVDLGQPLAPLLVQGSLSNLLDELPDHRRDPEELGRMGDGLLALFLFALGLLFPLGRCHDLRLNGVAHDYVQDIARANEARPGAASL